MVFMKMCRAIVFPVSLPKLNPKSGSSTGFRGLGCPCVHSQPHKCILPQVCLCLCFCLVFSPLMYFLRLSVTTTGTENGSSSQGTAGQSGLMAGSTGGVSKAAKGQGSAEKEDQTGNQKRARRQWESWSAEDKNSFFEGLYEVRVLLLLLSLFLL